MEIKTKILEEKVFCSIVNINVGLIYIFLHIPHKCTNAVLCDKSKIKQSQTEHMEMKNLNWINPKYD